MLEGVIALVLELDGFLRRSHWKYILTHSRRGLKSGAQMDAIWISDSKAQFKDAAQESTT